jgi:FKBP-type peptidyl-prolyl cis-trans isomerase
MGNKGQRFVIFMIIGVFLISIIGISLVAIGGGESASDEEVAQQLQEQADAQAAQIESQELLEQQQQACGQLPQQQGLSAIAIPDFDLPEGDVTELSTVDLEEGTGDTVQAGDCIIANYHGVTADTGEVFDSSFERGGPARFPLTGVIQGWQQAIPGMKEGGTRVLTIPSELAYGEFGSAPVIGPNEDLVFVVTIVEISE